MSTTHKSTIGDKLKALDWDGARQALGDNGWVQLPAVLNRNLCQSIIDKYEDDSLYRKRIVMQKHGYGSGEYRYYGYPLPEVIQSIRTLVYPQLVPVANSWHESMGIDVKFPETHDAFLKRCHDAGQVRPTPLILKYGTGDFNCLHQDLYGANVFPLQIAFLLSEPGKDFDGGEFILTEQRPRMQTKVEVVPLRQGDAVIFAVRNRPVKGTRGHYRVNMRHGVSRLISGHRYTAGVIFHDAE